MHLQTEKTKKQQYQTIHLKEITIHTKNLHHFQKKKTIRN